MKLYKLATIVLTLAAANAVYAQSLKMIASVPFDFEIQGHALAAGNYTIDQALSSHLLTVRGTDAKASVMALVPAIEQPGPQDSAKLVFHKYGDHYFLSQVWITGQGHSILPPTAVERELSGKLNVPGEVVLVALR